MKFPILVSLGAFYCSLAAAMDSVTIKGSKIFYPDGSQMFLKGMAYQPDFSPGVPGSQSNIYVDPLADPASCARDFPLMKALQTNVIRVYAIDSKLDHTQCMAILQANGIYLIADLSEPRTSIQSGSPVWNNQLYARYTSVVDVLQGYPNVLGFFAGNEVANSVASTASTAFVKAAVRDTKAYIKAKGYRNIAVGYAMNDDASIRVPMEDFLNCGNPDEAIDFLGYNIYSWCGDSNYRDSGYEGRTQELIGYSVPVFFSEYGCNSVRPRKFPEVQTIYSPPMSDVWSGAILYEWFQTENNYGLMDAWSTPATLLPDYEAFKSAIIAANPTGMSAPSYSPGTLPPRTCPSPDANWHAVASPLPPPPNTTRCACMAEAVSCGVKPNADTSKFGDIFGTVCSYGANICAEIVADGTTGTYGKYAMCDAAEKLSWAFDQWYKQNAGAASTCVWGGVAEVRTPVGTAAGCS